ncbi:hypothetical protein Tco_1375877 [Tanacetum coccineum]
MDAYLKKPEGSEGFHQIVNFLNASHIRYALTKNPTIYVSYIKQFWQTATARTLDNGEIELTVIIDGTVKTVTEASVRRHLQLADVDGISSLPTTEIFKQLSLMGRTTRQESVVAQPRSPTQTPVPDETVNKERGDSVERGIGSSGSLRRQDTILGDRPAQTRFKRLSKQSNDLPLSRVNTLGSEEDSMTQQELMVFYTTLSKKVESLETDLKQTKQIYGAAYTRLIKKVKKLEKTVKYSHAKRRARIVVSDDEDDLEDPSKQGRKIAETFQDPGISLVQHDAKIQGRYEHNMEFDFDFDAAKEVSTAGAAVTTTSVDVSTASPTRNTRVSTADDITIAETLVVPKAASSFNVEEWEDIQARVQADKELAQRLQAEEREKYTEAEQARMLAELINQRKRYFAAQRAEERRNKPPTQAQQRTYMSNYIKHIGESEVDRVVPELAAGSSKMDAEELDQEISEQGMNVEALQTKYPIIDWEIYTEGTRKYWKIIKVGNHTKSLVKEKFNSTEPTNDKEREIWVELKRLFEPDTDDELWKLQKHIHGLTWRLYDSCRVHHVSTEKGIDIYMLVEKEYPLSRGTLTLMMVAKLLVDQDNEMSRELLRKIFMQVERPRR